MTTLPSDLPLLVDRADQVPLAVQISAQLQAAVSGGVLRAGDRLPSSRDLAATLGVSRTVVTNAYARLFAEGWLEGRHGSGTYVANVAPPAAPAPPAAAAAVQPVGTVLPAGSASPAGSGTPGAGVPLARVAPPAAAALATGSPCWQTGERGRGSAQAAVEAHAERARVAPVHPILEPPRCQIDLQPGISWQQGIDPAAWRRAWRQAGAHLPSKTPDPHGLPELREEIAAYLRRARGLAVTPAQVLVTQGVSSGFALLVDAVLRPGDAAGVEEPGYPTAREVLRRAGAQVVPCRVDAHGIVPEELPAALRLLYTSPAHQYPLGGRLPVSRRQALVAWARATGALVVEDDYDSEFRYDVGPLPALHAMAPDAIVYLGTASKILATAFGAGWLVASPALVDELAALRPRLGVRIPEPVQHAILAMLRSGDLERHVRRMRLEYARRRAALVDGLTAGEQAAGGLPAAGEPGPGAACGRVPFRLLGDTAGMHVVLELPVGYPAARLVAAAAERGVLVYSLDRYYAGPPAMSGLILGYGTATLSQVRRAAAVLAPLLSRLP